ncbi:hypothetical protein ART_0001 [Arthrobacter sp. PAMC 25486]|nr:hypothetical protein ART_0001 [Arthrobacter sp. PAMC 25486]
MHHHRGGNTQPNNQFNINKLVSIKLGTLLSSGDQRRGNFSILPPNIQQCKPGQTRSTSLNTRQNNRQKYRLKYQGVRRSRIKRGNSKNNTHLYPPTPTPHPVTPTTTPWRPETPRKLPGKARGNGPEHHPTHGPGTPARPPIRPPTTRYCAQHHTPNPLNSQRPPHQPTTPSRHLISLPPRRRRTSLPSSSLAAWLPRGSGGGPLPRHPRQCPGPAPPHQKKCDKHQLVPGAAGPGNPHQHTIATSRHRRVE